MGTVRDASFEVMRAEGMTTIFSNPGSTEIPFLTDLPEDLKFVLALHESSVVGIATGHALASGTPAFVLLHTAAGYGNAVGAIATARANRAPLVVVVGQQDRRHLALQPFLAGQLDGLAGDYPYEVVTPAIATDVPSALKRAAHVARQRGGPVVVIVPMGDWEEPADEGSLAAAERVVVGPRSVPPETAEIAAALRGAVRPAIVAGAGNDSAEGWAALASLAELLSAPVWQEAFSSRAGFPHDHALYRGPLPASRTQIRRVLADCDVLLVVGTSALRQYHYESGRIVPDGTDIYVVTADETEANRSPARLAIVADPVSVCEELARESATWDERGSAHPLVERSVAELLVAPDQGEPLLAEHVFQLVAPAVEQGLALLVEAPSSRAACTAMIPATAPVMHLSAAEGGLGFAMPAGIGIKMAEPERAVLAVVGDGASMYSIQSLWTAKQLGVGIVFIVLNNGGYAVMDLLAAESEGSAPWPSFATLSVAQIADGMGVESRRLEAYADLARLLDEVVPHLASRTEPLVIEVVIEPSNEYGA